MRQISPTLAAHLADGVTTLCRCWRLVRRDGTALGFTDHDRDLAFGGTVFAARSGLEAAEASAELGFAVGGGEVAGALVSAGITESDIAAGLYDDAAVETWLVNWAAPGERLLLDTGAIGEIRRADGAFVAEVRGLMHRLDEERGRLYRDLLGGSRRLPVRRGPRVAHCDGNGRADGRRAFRRRRGSRPRGRLLHGRAAHLDRRRQCGADRRGEGASPRRRRDGARRLAA